MLTLRSRKYNLIKIDETKHQKMIDWKIASRKNSVDLPDDLYQKSLEIIDRFFVGFNFITVPAPSFHTYENYPIWEIAQKISSDLCLPLIKLFPNKTNKIVMSIDASIKKEVQKIELESGKFILVIDDLITTGNTGKVTCEAICKKNSFPCFLSFA